MMGTHFRERREFGDGHVLEYVCMQGRGMEGTEIPRMIILVLRTIY